MRRHGGSETVNDDQDGIKGQNRQGQRDTKGSAERQEKKRRHRRRYLETKPGKATASALSSSAGRCLKKEKGGKKYRPWRKKGKEKPVNGKKKKKQKGG